MSENEQNVNQQNDNEKLPDLDEKLLEEIRKLSKKQVKWQRLSALCILGALIVVIVVLFVLIPRVLITLDHINSVAAKVESSLEGVDTMVSEMTDASKNLNELVGDNSKALTDAIDQMANVDYEGLNQAIQDLQDAVGPMANFFNKFR